MGSGVARVRWSCIGGGVGGRGPGLTASVHSWWPGLKANGVSVCVGNCMGGGAAGRGPGLKSGPLVHGACWGARRASALQEARAALVGEGQTWES